MSSTSEAALCRRATSRHGATAVPVDFAPKRPWQLRPSAGGAGGARWFGFLQGVNRQSIFLQGIFDIGFSREPFKLWAVSKVFPLSVHSKDSELPLPSVRKASRKLSRALRAVGPMWPLPRPSPLRSLMKSDMAVGQK